MKICCYLRLVFKALLWASQVHGWSSFSSLEQRTIRTNVARSNPRASKRSRSDGEAILRTQKHFSLLLRKIHTIVAFFFVVWVEGLTLVGQMRFFFSCKQKSKLRGCLTGWEWNWGLRGRIQFLLVYHFGGRGPEVEKWDLQTLPKDPWFTSLSLACHYIIYIARLVKIW